VEEKTCTERLDNRKLEYIKGVVQMRWPNASDFDFEQIWALHRQSISKSSYMIQSYVKRKQNCSKPLLTSSCFGPFYMLIVIHDNIQRCTYVPVTPYMKWLVKVHESRQVHW